MPVHSLQLEANRSASRHNPTTCFQLQGMKSREMYVLSETGCEIAHSSRPWVTPLVAKPVRGLQLAACSLAGGMYKTSHPATLSRSVADLHPHISTLSLDSDHCRNCEASSCLNDLLKNFKTAL